MSTDDFQTKYTSFMESVVKSTIAETTKLFETMVEELKAELSKVKTENEALKTICRQTEAAKIVAITWSGQSSCPKMRDIAVQCDPLPSYSMSEVQPMEQRLNEHNKQCNKDDLVYIMLKDHNYDTAKDDNSKDSKPTMVSRVTQSIAADSTPSATCETDTEGTQINQHCLNIEVKKPSLEKCGVFLPEEQRVEPILLEIQQEDEQNELDLLENTTTWGTEGPINEIIEERKKLSIKVKHLEKTLMKALLSPTKCAGYTEQVKNLTSNCEGVKPSCWVTEVSPDQTEKDVTLVLPSMEQGTSRTSKIIESHNAAPLTASVFSLSEEVVSSDSQHSNLEVKKPVTDAANTNIPLLTRLTAQSPPLRSQQLRDCINSVKPRDVMQLVEAGDSTDRTTSQGKATTPDQCTVSFATLPSGVQCLILNPNLLPLLPTTANLSDKGTEEGFPNKTPFVPYTTDTNSQSNIGIPLEQQQEHTVTSSDFTATSSSLLAPSSKSLDQGSLYTPGILAVPLRGLTVSEPVPNIFVLSESPSDHTQHTNPPLSPKQISTGVSTFAAAYNNSTSLSLENSQRKYKIASSPAAPLVICDATEQMSVSQTRIKIVIPRSAPFAASQSLKSKTIDTLAMSNLVGPDIAVQSSSQLPKMCAKLTDDQNETPVAVVPMPLVFSTLSSPQPNCSSTHMDILSNFQILSKEQNSASATESLSTNCSSVAPPNTEEIPPHVTVLTKSLWTSRENKSIVPPDRILSLVNEQVTKPTNCPGDLNAISTGTCDIVREPFVAENLNSSSTSVNVLACTNAIRKTVNCVPCTSSIVSEPILEGLKAEFSVGADHARKVSVTLHEGNTNNVDKELINNTILNSNSEFSPFHFRPDTEELSDHHLQLIKNEFHAQLSVSPGIQDYHKASTNESRDGKHMCNETGSLRKLQKKSGVTDQQCHIENHPQAKVRKATPEQRSDTQCTQNCTKKPRLESVTATEQRTTDEPISICTHTKSLSPTRKTNVFSQVGLSNQQNIDISSRESRTSFQLVSVGTQHTGVSLYSQSERDSKTLKASPILPLTDSEINITHENTAKDGFKSDSLKIEDTFESITKNTEKPFTAKNVAIQTLESTIYLRSKLTRETTDMTILKSQQTRRSAVKPSLNKYADSPNRSNVTGLRLRSGTTNNTMPQRNKHSPEIRNKSVTAKVNSIVKTTQLNLPPEQSGLRKTAPPPRTRSTRNSTRPKFPPPGQNRSSLTKDVPFPKTPYCESLRSYTFSKESASKQMKVQSRSLSGKTTSLSAVRAKMTKNSSSTRETTANKSRLNSPCSISKNTVKIQNVKELANPAKGKTMAKNKQTKSKKNNTVLNFYNIDKDSELVRTSFEPRAREATPLRETRSSLSIQRDKRTARAQNCFPVSPPNLSNQLIYVKAPTVVSPLQPLAVIGERLLKNQCGDCGRVLSSTAALESHVSLHTGHRPFLCALCGKSFPDAKGLKRHGRVHRDERIHVCQQCGKGFVYGFGLTKHIQMVHGKIKPFPCQICNKSFFTKRDVEIHLRIHTGEKPFHCNLCEKKFARKVELNVHLRWHNGEKRHWCPFCGKGFLDYNNLKRHKYIHTGEKPHSCPHCPKHFTQSGHLKKHVKNVHKVV